MIKAVLMLIVIYTVYRLYRRIFLEKRCSSCEKYIRNPAPICHHCNTVQAECVVMKAGSLDQNIKPPAKLLRSPLVLILLVLSQVAVLAAIYFFDSLRLLLNLYA